MPQLTNLAFFRARRGPDPGARSGSCRPSRAHTGRSRMPQLRPLPVIENAEIWFVYENWCSMQDLDSHMKSVHLRAFLTAAPTLVEGDIDLRRFTMISTPATR
jgi:quinol monooxygenase YgiN